MKNPQQVVEVKGLKELEERFRQYPVQFQMEVSKAVGASLLVFHEKVPPYPPKPPESRYRRTHTLDRSLGTIGGPHNIYQIRKIGAMGFEGRFGTNLKYAPYVIGPPGTQREPFSSYWWRLDQVPDKAQSKILEIFQKLTQRLAAFLSKK